MIDREIAVQWAKEVDFGKSRTPNLYFCFPNEIQDLVNRAIEYGRQQAAPMQQEPVPWTDIVSAIQAVIKEASERGKMFPQEAEAHSEDRAASRRVCELIKWYATCGGSVAEKLEGWPKRYAPPPTPPDVAELVEAATGALKEIQGAMFDAYNNAQQVCCGRAGNECCGCPDAEWSEKDQKTMDRFVQHENALRTALAKHWGAA